MVSESQRIPVAIEDEMKSSFMDYAMSVIVARALPDARDGLKPVHRRILFAQHQVNNVWNRAYVKCARIVGDVLGKFHPHGDAATYDALVRMAQDFSMRYQLIDGQGNFGSIDGDPPAAYRYTECRMTRLASEMLADIDKETVDWTPNYDDKELEPVVLPTKVPNLLLNGASGIAVGMATNIPPHNSSEVIDATIALIRNPGLTPRELIRMVPGPDFPTGGIIYGRAGITQAYETGRGRIIVRGKTEFEEMKGGRTAIIVSEVPYQVNKASWIEQTADLVREKRLEGISDIRDESDRHGIRAVFELKRDAVPAVVLNNLFKMTALQSTYGINMLAIVENRPRVLTLKDALLKFVEHRREVITRRCVHQLREARARRELVEGLGLAVMQIDRVIEIIRTSKDPDEAKGRICMEPMRGLDGFLERAGRPEAEVAAARARGTYQLNERQAQAILDMRLQRLTGLEREKLEAEYRELWETTDRLEAILADEQKLLGVIVDELVEIRTQYGDERRTQIVDVDAEITDEQLIADEDMVVTVTHGGYVKRTPVTEYRAQQRGGRGVKGAGSGNDDFVAELFVASTHDHILMFTDRGRVYEKRVFDLPPGKRDARGKAIVNVVELQAEEKVIKMLPVKSFDPGWYVFMATKSGTVKKTELEAFKNIRSTGIRAVGLDEGDELVSVRLTNGEMDVLLGTRNGYALRFREDRVRPMGRDARGVRGVAVRSGDEVVGMATVPRDSQETLLTVCARGYGKRTALAEYPTKNRGGMGVISIRTSARNGKVVALRVVSNEDHLILITDKGKLIRVPVEGIPVVGRATQGVRIMRVDEGEQVSGVERLAEPEEQERIAEAVPVAAEPSEPEEEGPEEPELLEEEPEEDPGDGE
ncbi:MAG: DNA gyrase subunit A [Deltaproteobacteria bacterium]|nr:DNA gyrase subunit A [Deltaproteobacteria bacterium]